MGWVHQGSGRSRSSQVPVATRSRPNPNKSSSLDKKFMESFLEVTNSASPLLVMLLVLCWYRHLSAIAANDESILSNTNGVPGFPPKKATYSCIQMNGKANQRIIDVAASRLDIPSDKVISNLANYGNTSAASIPLTLDEAVRSGKVKTGDIIATSGFGAGLTWGSTIVKWG
ncbi:3-oxoacyl-[acyl-carrier-protein] synthase III, chloroplastic [Zea mays]|uniref:3-oxoacyl-[acyl-carrier-protein] synthase III, chloroplastic n=1 Tax=Zea mays TaxID=4577 RepID=A0A3L6FTW5_MAIZE|nr:3-oxoacyl-[acyl-carrier-protein] synthase III, chloroplastic [Zea mays]